MRNHANEAVVPRGLVGKPCARQLALITVTLWESTVMVLEYLNLNLITGSLLCILGNV